MGLKVLLYNWEGENPKFKKTKVNFMKANDTKKLRPLLCGHDFDLIVLGDSSLPLTDIDEIYRQFQVPFLVPSKLKLKQIPEIAFCRQENWVYDADLQMCVELHRHLRQSQKNKMFLGFLQKFEAHIPFAQDEIFIGALKRYFHDILTLGDVHWVTLEQGKPAASTLLVLLTHLKKQKNDYADLVSDLESYEREYKKSECWQIWQDENNQSLAILWVKGSEGKKHCLILNKIQKINLNNLVNLMDLITPLLQKRWNLCMLFADKEKQIYIDSLTNLYNQKYLNLTLDKKIEENRRYQTPFSILFIDIDYFKQVNDSLGHVTGSDVLKQLGQVIQDQVRSSDYAFRYGGDEFIVLLSQTQGDLAHLFAERIRNKVEGHNFKSSGHDISITVSIGLAFFPEHASSAVDIIRIADEAMYYGKNASRNIVYKAS